MKHRQTRLHEILLGLVALVMAAGCGSSGGGTGGTTSPVSGGGTSGPDTTADFAFLRSASLNTKAVPAGGTTTLPITLNSVNGFPSNVTITPTIGIRSGSTFTAAPAGWSVTATPPTTTLTAGQTPLVLTVTAPAGAQPLDTYQIRVKAEGGGLTRYLNPGTYNANEGSVSVQVPGLKFGTDATSSPFLALTGTAGNTASGTISVETFGFAGTVPLSAGTVPPGVSLTFATPTLTADGTFQFLNSNATLTATGNVAPGNYTLTVKAVYNGVTYTSAPLPFVVQ